MDLLKNPDSNTEGMDVARLSIYFIQVNRVQKQRHLGNQQLYLTLALQDKLVFKGESVLIRIFIHDSNMIACCCLNSSRFAYLILSALVFVLLVCRSWFLQ